MIFETTYEKASSVFSSTCPEIKKGWSLTSIPLELTPGTKSDARSVLTDCLSHCLHYFEGKTSTIPDRTTVLICANGGYSLYKMIDEVTYIRIRLICGRILVSVRPMELDSVKASLDCIGNSSSIWTRISSIVNGRACYSDP